MWLTPLLLAKYQVVVNSPLKVLFKFAYCLAFIAYKSVIRQVKYLSIKTIVFFTDFYAPNIAFICQCIHISLFLVKKSNV